LIGGTTNGTIRYQTFASLSNALFATDILISDSGVLGPGAFSFTDFANIALAGTYSLTSVVTITHSVSVTNSSFNATVEIGEPGLISMISMISLSGLLFAAGISARRRQKNARVFLSTHNKSGHHGPLFCARTSRSGTVG
jgi:hypothetical protein